MPIEIIANFLAVLIFWPYGVQPAPYGTVPLLRPSGDIAPMASSTQRAMWRRHLSRPLWPSISSPNGSPLPERPMGMPMLRSRELLRSTEQTAETDSFKTSSPALRPAFFPRRSCPVLSHPHVCSTVNAVILRTPIKRSQNSMYLVA
jgi:hypothetical protein